MGIFGLIILLGILLVDYYLFIKLNSKFIDKYPQYSGKFLWTLFFFPIMFQVSIFLWEIVTILSIFSFTSLSDEAGFNYVDKMLFRTLRNWSIISIFIFGVASYFIYKCRLSLNNILFNWEERKKDFKSHQEFWIPKIERNMQRDKEVTERLQSEGWTVLRFWGNDIKKNVNRCADIIEAQVRATQEQTA